MAVFRQVVVTRAHQPGVAERDNALVDVQPFGSVRMPDVNRRQSLPVKIQSMFFNDHPLAADELDETEGGGVAPKPQAKGEGGRRSAA